MVDFLFLLLLGCKAPIIETPDFGNTQYFGNNKARSYVLLAILQEQQGQNYAALQSFQMAIQHDPHPTIYRLWGESALRQGEIDIAKEAWQEYILLNPNDAQIIQQLEAL